MKPTACFCHALHGGERPQILLMGNGLERSCGCEDWNRLLNRIDVRFTDGHGNVPEDQKEAREKANKLPFPLLYELLATPPHPPAHLSPEDIHAEEQKLAGMMAELLATPMDISGKYQLFQKLPSLDADHILTTNYTYLPEKAFRPQANFVHDGTRNYYRFNLNPVKDQKGKPKSEIYYRLHTGYQFGTKERKVGIWHIHGECSVSRGVVLGHDRYGRLLNRIVNCCGEIDFDQQVKDKTYYDHGDRMSYKSITKKTGWQECGQEQEEEVSDSFRTFCVFSER